MASSSSTTDRWQQLTNNTIKLPSMPDVLGATDHTRSSTVSMASSSDYQQQQQQQQQQEHDDQLSIKTLPTTYLLVKQIAKQNANDPSIGLHVAPSLSSSLPPHKHEAMVRKCGQRLNPKHLYKVPLTPIDCRFGIVREEEDYSKQPLLHSAILQQQNMQNAELTVVFCVRRPGCGSCRDHAQQLVRMVHDLHIASSTTKRVETQQNSKRIALMAISKHGRGVDDPAMMNFYQTYFNRNPIYKDEHWKTFDALGARKISTFNLLKLVPRMNKRYAKNNIENVPFGGDIFTQGGILIFDKQGKLRHVYYENYGDRLDVEGLKSTIENIQKEQKQSSK